MPVCAISTSNTGTSAIRQQMNRTPTKTARIETTNLILSDMKTLSFGRKYNSNSKQYQHTKLSGHNNDSGEQSKTART